METWIQLTFPVDPANDEIPLPPEDQAIVVEAMARLLLQVQSVQEAKENGNDVR